MIAFPSRALLRISRPKSAQLRKSVSMNLSAGVAFRIYDPYLDPGLGQVNFLGNIFSCKSVRVVGLFKDLFQRIQLSGREGSPVPSLLLLANDAFVLLRRLIMRTLQLVVFHSMLRLLWLSLLRISPVGGDVQRIRSTRTRAQVCKRRTNTVIGNNAH